MANRRLQRVEPSPNHVPQFSKLRLRRSRVLARRRDAGNGVLVQHAHLPAEVLEAVPQVILAGREPVQPVVDSDQPLVDAIQPLVDAIQPLVDAIQPPVDTIQPLINSVEPALDDIEPLVDPFELLVDSFEVLADCRELVINSIETLFGHPLLRARGTTTIHRLAEAWKSNQRAARTFGQIWMDDDGTSQRLRRSACGRMAENTTRPPVLRTVRWCVIWQQRGVARVAGTQKVLLMSGGLMKLAVSVALAVLIAAPSLAVAQEQTHAIPTAGRTAREVVLRGGDRIRAAVVGLPAATAPQTEAVGTRRSKARVTLGIAMVGAGMAMLLVDPKQPSQPGEVLQNTLVDETASFLSSTQFLQLVASRGTTWTCYPNFLQSCEFTANAYLSGVVDGGLVGAAGAINVATQGDRTVYASQIQPFKKRSTGLKGGGAAMVIGGALVTALWSSVPVVRHVAVAPTSRGFRVSSAVEF